MEYDFSFQSESEQDFELFANASVIHYAILKLKIWYISMWFIIRPRLKMTIL